MTREEIKAIIPHREPMLLIDSAECEGADTAVGSYTVRGDEFFLQGHFPGNPVVPGVILCEIMAQACCVLLADRAQGKTPYYTGLNKVKFRRRVTPGDRLDIRCRLVKNMGAFYFAEGQISVGGETAVSGEFSFAIV